MVEESVSLKLDSWIKINAKDLKIRQQDRRWAAEMVNDFRDNLLKFLRLKSDQPFLSAEFLNSGSYFEKVKIKKADEFDMMLKLQGPLRPIMTKLDDGLFYKIHLAQAPKGPIRAFLLEDGSTLSSSKILSEMYRLVRTFLKTYKVPESDFLWAVNRKQCYSPAVTLSLTRKESSDELISVDLVPALEVQSWPVAARSGPDVDNWLGKKVRQDIKSLPCFYVPKRLKGGNSEEARESWRISFSHVEKQLIRSHGNKKTCCESHNAKCCRKPCYMLLKSLIEGLKLRFPNELEQLCSYQGKTVFLHTMSKRWDDALWTPENLTTCFLHLLKAMENHARTGLLPHFFVPDYNLFSPAVFPRRKLDFLVSALEEQRREGLPLLRHPAPVPAIIPCITLEKQRREGLRHRDPVQTIRPTSPSGDTSPLVSTDKWSVVSGYLTTFLLLFAAALVCVLLFKFGLRW